MQDSKIAVADGILNRDHEAGMIYDLMPKVARAVGALGKGQTSYKGWKFRGIDDVWNVFGPKLWEFGITVSSEADQREVHWLDDLKIDKKKNAYATLRLKLTFIAPDGSRVSGQAYGASVDHDYRAMAQAHSDACKKIFFEVFTPPVDPKYVDDPDKRKPMDEPFEEQPAEELYGMSVEDLKAHYLEAKKAGASKVYLDKITTIGKNKKEE